MFLNTASDIVWRIGRKIGLVRDSVKADDTEIHADQAIARAGEFDGDLAKIFFQNEDRLIHKWLHYIPIYERYLARYRGTDFKMLEIGVFKGGSLGMWRKYFGVEAMLYGIDINPDCANYVDPPNQVRIGSQADPAFLEGVAREMGPLDVILDDGSHVSEHQRISFETLFPHLKEGGLYIIEDLCTAYWPLFNGGYRRRGTAIELFKAAVDDLNHWHHPKGFATAARDQIGAVHFHDSLAVIEKVKPLRPAHARIGRDPTPKPPRNPAEGRP